MLDGPVDEFRRLWVEARDRADPATTDRSNSAELPPVTSWEKSVSAITDLADLERELANREWKDADLLTDTLMVLAVGRRGTDWVRDEELSAIPCTLLREMDALWLKHSGGRFGFSVQLAIWQSLEGVGVHTVGDGDLERAFGNRVGWRARDKWPRYDEYIFSLRAPLGHLPRYYCRHASGWWVGRSAIVAATLLKCAD